MGTGGSTGRRRSTSMDAPMSTSAGRRQPIRFRFAAWIRFPELDVVASAQRYTRLADNRWRYQSGQYDFDLTTDVASGLVLAYGDDLWRAVATSTRLGAGDTTRASV